MAMSEKIGLNISKVLDFVRDRGFFPGFERVKIENYDMKNSFDVITAIGKMRSPRFTIDDENRFAYENFIKWCHADTTMRALNPMTGEEIQGDVNRGIYIAGNTGSGKSWCLEIMLAYAQAWEFEIRFLDEKSNKPLLWRINRADEICECYSEKGETSRFKKFPIIGIQDFGQEPKETLYMGNRMNVLQQVIEYRGDRRDQLTLITSNLRISSEILKKDYGDRVQSRLCEMCNYLEIKGKDRRKWL